MLNSVVLVENIKIFCAVKTLQSNKYDFFASLMFVKKVIFDIILHPTGESIGITALYVKEILGANYKDRC